MSLADLSAIIKNYRASRNLTFAKLAAQCDLSTPTVWKIEEQCARPDIPTIDKLAKGMGIKPEDLLSAFYRVAGEERANGTIKALYDLGVVEGLDWHALSNAGAATLLAACQHIVEMEHTSAKKSKAKKPATQKAPTRKRQR